ncbi:MAG: hypothetical protein ACPGGK_05335 [Pikeienuella sp.]
MDEITNPDAKTEEEQAQLIARRKERRARRRMRQAMAEAAAAAAADQAREEGAEAPKPDYENARPETGRRGDDQAKAEPVVGDNSKTQKRGTEIARVQPTKLQKAPAAGALADTVPDDAFLVAQRAREARMKDIRKELRRRRRLRSLGILLRFAIFVLIPTAVVGWYYYEKATDMYVSESAMVFKGASLAGGASGAAGLLGGGALPTDPISLQEYILSRDLLKRLDAEHGWIAHFQSESIDEYHRLPAGATFDDAYSYFQGNFLTSGKVEVSFDLMEGIIRMEVTGATPEAAKRFADAIIAYGEEQVNSLNARSRFDGLEIADEGVNAAKAEMIEAQNKINELQEQIQSFDILGESAEIQARISQFEAEIDGLKAQISKLETVAKDPNDSRYIPLRLDLKTKEAQVKELRARLIGDGNSGDGRPSNAQLNSMMLLAQTDLGAAQLNYNSALQSKQIAIQTASQQSLYLETVVQPSAPQKADKPNRMANTGLVFLVLFAAYIIGMLTVSLIREQAAI